MVLDCTLGFPGHVEIKFAGGLDHLDYQIGRAKVVTKEFSAKFSLKRAKIYLKNFCRFFRYDFQILHIALPPKRAYISFFTRKKNFWQKFVKKFEKKFRYNLKIDQFRSKIQT